MKVLIDGQQNEFINIFRPSGGSAFCNFWQCNTQGNASAHNFNQHPKNYPKDTEIKTNGHIYIFPSK